MLSEKTTKGIPIYNDKDVILFKSDFNVAMKIIDSLINCGSSVNKTNKLELFDKNVESISGSADNQFDVNKEIVERLKETMRFKKLTTDGNKIYDGTIELTFDQVKALYQSPEWFIYLEYLNIIMIPSSRYNSDTEFEFSGQYFNGDNGYQASITIDNTNHITYKQIACENMDTNKVYDINDYDEENEEQYFNAKTIKDYVDSKIIETFVFKGYVSNTQPDNAKDNELWYLGNTMPTTFPINVKRYKNGAWSTLVE